MLLKIILQLIRTTGLTGVAKKIRALLQGASLWPKNGFGYGFNYSHRDNAYRLLSGRGLEVGALNCPAALPPGCRMEYCDAQSREESAALFPEINKKSLVAVNHIVDLDTGSLTKIPSPLYDFVIMNHVIEHVANPISVFKQLSLITKDGGHIVISAPDKEFTFDRNRPLTSFEHLVSEYQEGVKRVDDTHYLEMIRFTNPQIFYNSDPQIRLNALQEARSRREHAHVWNSRSFMDFLSQAAEYLHLRMTVVYTSSANDNGLESFVVLKKENK